MPPELTAVLAETSAVVAFLKRNPHWPSQPRVPLVTLGWRGAEWIFGRFKSPRRWANQLKERDWTPEEITEVIETGENYRVEYRVNPGNPARQYHDPKTGRFVVRDEMTGEILQISGGEFKPNPPIE